MALIGLFSWKLWEKKMNIYLKNLLKKEACMFSTVCTRYIHVALAAYVPMLWERFTFGHSCNYSVVLSKNVSTWNKKKHLVIFLYIFPEKKKRSLVLVSYSWKPFSHELLWKNTRLQITLPRSHTDRHRSYRSVQFHNCLKRNRLVSFFFLCFEISHGSICGENGHWD